MKINYKLDEITCLNFLKKHIHVTKAYKKSQFNYITLYLLVLILICIALDNWFIKLCFAILVFIMISKFKSIILISFTRKFKKSLGLISPIIFSNTEIFLSISNNVINLKSEYENLSIPFDKITGIYSIDNFLFITNSITKDILIPLNTFDSPINKTLFLDNFNIFTIQNSFPSNYSFI